MSLLHDARGDQPFIPNFASVLFLLNLTIMIIDVVELYDPWIYNAGNLVVVNQM